MTFFTTLVIKVAILMAFDDRYTCIVFHTMHCKIVWFVKKSIIIYWLIYILKLNIPKIWDRVIHFSIFKQFIKTKYLNILVKYLYCSLSSFYLVSEVQPTINENTTPIMTIMYRQQNCIATQFDNSRTTAEAIKLTYSYPSLFIYIVFCTLCTIIWHL